MHNKKILSAIGALAVSVTLIGGTLAWFTSNDSVTNTFATGSTNRPNDPDAGVDVEENFTPPTELLPGTETNKDVWVKSTANYDQFLRVSITKVWKFKGREVTHYTISEDGKITYYNEKDDTVAGAIELNDSKIKLNLVNTNQSATTSEDTWTKEKNGYYYYNQILKPNSTTANLLGSVTFVSDEDDNYYKNLTFDVIVTAEGVQATKDAVSGSTAAPGWDGNIPTHLIPQTTTESN